VAGSVAIDVEVEFNGLVVDVVEEVVVAESSLGTPRNSDASRWTRGPQAAMVDSKAKITVGRAM
jgi:hypothetical protein